MYATESKYYNDSPFFKMYFNWNIIAFQCCVGLCSTTAWLNYKYTYIPSLLSLLPTCLPPQVIPEHQAELPVLHSSLPLAVCFMHDRVYVSVLTLSLPPCAHTSILHVCISIPALQIGLSVPFF